MSNLRAWLDEERGRGVALARDLNVSSAAIAQWADSQVPAERIFRVSELTKIPIEELRPDLFKNGDEARKEATDGNPIQ